MLFPFKQYFYECIFYFYEYVFELLYYILLKLLRNSFSSTIGKPFLLKTIANCALDCGLNVCLSAPTRKLSSTYAHQLRMCRCNTVHINYFIPVNKTAHPNTINWTLSDVHVLPVDEVIDSKYCQLLLLTQPLDFIQL